MATSTSTSNHKKYPKAKYWCFTCNFTGKMLLEDSEHHIDYALDDILKWMPKSTYAVFQTEMGEAGNMHIQGYIEFSQQVRLSHLRANWKWVSQPHWEIRKGTQKQAIDYCQKDHTAIIGTQKSFGKPFGKKARKVPYKCTICNIILDGLDVVARHSRWHHSR